jgi:hypothetical protein
LKLDPNHAMAMDLREELSVKPSLTHEYV